MFKKICAPLFALLALALVASIQPAGAIPLWSQSLGDVNFPGLRAGANIVTAPTATKIAGGESTFTGTGTAATGLTAIAACTVTIKVGTAPGVGTSVVTYTRTNGTLNLFAWKPTSNADPTLIAATAAATVGWVCTGS